MNRLRLGDEKVVYASKTFREYLKKLEDIHKMLNKELKNTTRRFLII